jgi:IclR family KDG regulon transcriptional repressor
LSNETVRKRSLRNSDMAGIEPVKAVNKTMGLLEALAQEKEMGVIDLAGRAGMHKSTVYRFLNSLKELGYVRQNTANEKYSLTLKLFELGSCVLGRMELWEQAHPILEQLAEQTHETIHLAVLDDGSLVYLGKIESTQALRVSMSSRVGQSAPTHCTGVGKLLLAYAPPEQVERILKREGLRRFTEHTITERSLLAKELDSIRQNGFAIDDEEHEVGVRCVAAPVRNNQGTTVAALSISMPSVRLPNAEIPRYREFVTKAAEEISRRIGAAPEEPVAAGG